MNLYRLHSSPQVSAIWVPDKTLASMVIWSGWALTTAHRFYDGNPGRILIANNMSQYPWILPKEDLGAILPLVFLRRDEAAIWTRTTRANYYWMFYYFDALLREFKFRHGFLHSYAKYLEFVLKSPGLLVSMNEMPWPDDRDRNALIGDSPTWTYRKEPPWYEKR